MVKYDINGWEVPIEFRSQLLAIFDIHKYKTKLFKLKYEVEHTGS